MALLSPLINANGFNLQANFVIGIGDLGANVYCVDFGLSKRYRHPKTLQHIPHRDGRSLTGTPRYARCVMTALYSTLPVQSL